jgi:hypothetical protein
MAKDRRAEMQEFLAVLQAAKNRLEYVTPNDWALILDKATRRSFARSRRAILSASAQGTSIMEW